MKKSYAQFIPLSNFLPWQNKVSLKILTAGFILMLLMAHQTKAQVPAYFKGTGTATQTSPMNTSGAHSQQLYMPGDFGSLPASGNITKIYFRNSSPNATGTYINFSVAFIQNGLNAFPTNTFLTGLTTALSTPSQFVQGNAVSGGWYSITLATPFYYDNTQSLVVEIKYTSRTNGLTSYITTATANKRLSITGPPSPLVGSLSTNWSDFGMDITVVPCTDPPNAGTSNASPGSPMCQFTPITLSLSAHTPGASQQYQWSSSPTINGTYTDIGSLQSSAVLVTPATSTLYYRCAVTCGATTILSVPVLVTVIPGLASGTYTVNPGAPASSTNFQSMTSAVSALNCGIIGPVVFNVDPTTPYNEQITIPVIANVSAVNTVIFNGNGSTIQFTPVTGARHIIKLSGADYVTFDDFIIKSLDANFGWGVHLMNGSDHNTISNTTIDLLACTNIVISNSAGIVASSSSTSISNGSANNANFLSVTGCTIKGGNRGIQLLGQSPGLNAVSNSIVGNTIHDFYDNGITLIDNDGALIASNNIHRTNRITVIVFEGIEMGEGNRNALITHNRIHDTHNSASSQSSAYGIFMDGCVAPVGQENRVVNNLIYNFNSISGLQYGLYNSGASGVYWFHNTVVFDQQTSTGGTTYAYFQTSTSTNLQAKNNLLFVTRTGTGTKNCMRFSQAASVINNNILYINTPFASTFGIGNFNGTNYTTLAQWQAVNLSIYDQQSVSSDPVFVSPGTGNYAPSAFVVDNVGVNTGVATDINNIVRSLTTPDAGAYEFTVSAGVNVGATALVAPATTGCYTNAQQVIIRIKNFGTLVDFAAGPVTVTTNISGAVIATISAVINTGTLGPDSTMDITMSAPLDMSVNGTYTFDAFTTSGSDTDNSNDAMPTVNRIRSAIAAGTVTPNQTTPCISATPVLTIAGNSGGNRQWQESTVSSSGPWTNVGSGGTTYTPAVPVTQTTHYRVESSCMFASAQSNVSTIEVYNPEVTSAAGASRCGPGSVTLQATGSAGSGLNWYAGPSGGSSLGTGNNFTTPILNNTTNFYVAAKQDTGSNSSVGWVIPNAFSTGVGVNTYGLLFTASAPFNLNTVTLYPNSLAANTPGTVTIGIYNATVTGSTFTTGTLQHQVTVNVTGNPQAAMAVAQTVLLNFNIQPGSYFMTPVSFTGISSLMFQGPPTLPSFPYIVPDYMSIYSSGFSGNLHQDVYFYFYDWNISSGCEGSRTMVTAVVVPAPLVSVQPVTAVCGGQPVQLSASSTNDPSYNYSWMPGNQIGANVTVSPAVTTTYTVTATDTSGGPNNGCSNTETVTVNVFPTPAGSATADPGIICLGDSVQLVSGISGGDTYSWNPSSSIASPSSSASKAKPAVSTTYTVTVTNSASGCTFSSSIHVQVSPVPAPYIIPGDSVLCTGQIINITTRDSGAYASGWPAGTVFDYGFGPTPDSTFEINGPGIYQAIVTLPAISGSCSATTGDAGISFRDSPVLLPEEHGAKCNGASTGFISSQVALGQAPYRYKYYNSTGTLIRDTVSNLAEDTLSGISAGAYAVVVGDLSGSVYPPPSCTSDSVIIVVSEAEALIAAETHGAILCPGGSASVSITAAGGTPPYSGIGTFTQSAGTVVYPVSDANGCLGSVEVTLYDATPASVSFNTSYIPCAYSTANVTAIPEGGSPGYSYLWSNGTTGATATGLSDANYTVTVTDGNGCSTVASTPVITPGQLGLTGTAVNPACRGIASGSIAIAVTGAVPGYSYIWNNGSTIQNRSNLGPGTYTVTVTDVNGCTKSGSWTVTQPATNLLINFSKTNIRCFGANSGVATVAPSGGTGPYTYLWNTFPVKTTASVNSLPAGAYTCTVTDAVGCAKSVLVTITQPDDIIVFQTQTNVTFPGGNNGTASVSVSGGTPGYTYSWNTLPVKTTATITGLTSGTYKCTVIDSKTCSKKVSFIITEPIARMVPVPESSEWNLTVAPNPSLGNVLLSFTQPREQNVHITVSDYTGRLVFEGGGKSVEGLNEFAYDFTNFDKGIYFIKLTAGTESKVIRIVIH